MTLRGSRADRFPLLLTLPLVLALACGGSQSGGGGQGGGAQGGSTSGTGGRGGPGPLPFPIPDGGIPLDAAIAGLMDAGVLTVCPPAPEVTPCGTGAPLCIVPGTQPPRGCLCVSQRWLCLGAPGTTPPRPDAGPLAPPTRPDAGSAPAMCPIGAPSSSCTTAGALCTTGFGICGCLMDPATNSLRWICTQ